MGFKSVLAALSGSSSKKRSAERSRFGREELENESPLVPKRLLTPGGPANGTPRSLHYDAQATPQRSRMNSLVRASPQPHQVQQPSQASGRAASTPARTPARLQTRFGQQQHEQVRPTAAADAAGALADAAGSLADGGDNIRVVLRVRPRSERETSVGGGICVQPLGSSAVKVASHPEPHSFSFDYVAGDSTTQETVFKVSGKPIVDNCLAGYNGCIFAYGQTGSGKTYTMLGGAEGECDPRDDSRGLIQRVFEHLFACIAQGQAGGGGKYLLECSFLEIYNETITDLLDPTRTNLQVRENLKGPYVSNMTAHEVYRAEDVAALLRTGQANRRMGETNMNETSSRSHSVFTCKLQSKTVDEFGTSHVRCSRLHLVDLAGSERQKASGAQGERLKEATAINKSLSALGNVIMSLVDQQHGRMRHIPYRDSRLTYLLQDSLGGNAKTCLIATVSPAAVNMAETLSTLRFADQAKRIKNQAVVNEDTDGDKAALKHEIKRLNDELAAAKRGQLSIPTSGGVGGEGAYGSGTPGRLQAAADAMLAGSPHGTGQEGGRRKALVGALRREDAAVKEAKRLEAELEGMRGLLKAKESDLQRSQMMMKLKESRLARMQQAAGSLADVPAEVADLQREIDLLKAKVESHPEVKRFAVENLHLSETVKKYETIVKRNELAALHVDVDALRGEMLRLEEEFNRAQEDARAASAQATASRLEADAAAASIRAQAVAEAQSKAANEASQLRQQMFEQHRAAQGQEGLLCAANRDNEELQARVTLLQETVEQLESSHADLRQELSPAKKQMRQYEQELGLVRQESQSANLRASTEQTLRSQAELTSHQLQQRVASLEAECQQLRSINQELFSAKSDAQEQRDSVASVEVELATLRVQLEREQATTAERQSHHAGTLAELDNSRQRVAALESEVLDSQRGALDAKAELEQQQAEHEAALTAAAARITAALKAATEMQSDLDSRTARVLEQQQAQEALQAEADDLRQRCTQLHDASLRTTSMLAQRDNELSELEQMIEEKDAELAQRAECIQELTAELSQAQAALAEKAAGLVAATAAASGAAADLALTEEKLADATAAIRDASDQLAELQDRLSAADSQQAQLEYELSDKSASLREASEQVVELKRQLADVKQQHGTATAQAAAVGSRAEQAAAELDQANRRAAELAVLLAGVESQVEAQQQEAASRQQQAEEVQQQMAAKEQQVEQQRQQVEQAQQQAGDLAAQLRTLQQGTLLEKEQQLILGRAEVKELRQQLAQQEAAAEAQQAQLEARNGDIAQLRHDMAAEVGEAAQQVQQLLAALGRVQQLEEELQAVRQQATAQESEHSQLPLRVAEAVAAARSDARAQMDLLEQQLAERERDQFEEVQAAIAEAATMTSEQAQDQIHQLIAEREAWIEEVQTQRIEATAAVESSRSLERRVAELAEERVVLAAALEDVQLRAGKLEDELTHLTGQQNIQQRIHYHKKIKDENSVLREELARLRIDQHRTQVRYDRVSQDLQKLREANGQEGLPDFDAEEALRDALAATEQQKLQLEKELECLAQSVLVLVKQSGGGSGSAAAGTPGPAASASSDEQDDIVLEFGSPQRPAAEACTAARRALADISAQQAAAARSLEDQRQQIRLLQESSKLQKLRRTSVLDKQQQQRE